MKNKFPDNKNILLVFSLGLFLLILFTPTNDVFGRSVSVFNNLYASFLNVIIPNSGVSQPLSVDDIGQVGIGINTPTAKLDVDGQIRIRGGTPAEDEVLVSDTSGLASWEVRSNGITNPMTALGDLIVGGVNGALTHLPKGIAGQVLKIDNSGVLYWGVDDTGSGGTTLPADAIGLLRNNGSGFLSWSSILDSDISSLSATKITGALNLSAIPILTLDKIPTLNASKLATGGSSGQVLKNNGVGGLYWDTDNTGSGGTTLPAGGPGLLRKDSGGTLSWDTNAYVTNSSLTTTLGGYVTNTSLNSTLSGYVTSTILNSLNFSNINGSIVTTQITPSAISGKVLKTVSGSVQWADDNTGGGGTSLSHLSDAVINWQVAGSNNEAGLADNVTKSTDDILLASGKVIGFEVPEYPNPATGIPVFRSRSTIYFGPTEGSGGVVPHLNFINGSTVGKAPADIVGSDMRFSIANPKGAFTFWPAGYQAIDGEGNNPLFKIGPTGVFTRVAIINLSDLRLKENISKLNNVLGKIKRLDGVSFKFINGNQEKQIGFIAQDVQEEFPELVTKMGDDSDYLGLNYSGMSAILLEGLKELDDKVIALQERYGWLYDDGLIVDQSRLAVAKLIIESLAIKKSGDESVNSIGDGVIPAGRLETVIANNLVKENFKIFITPISSTGGQAIFIKSIKNNESFVVGIDNKFDKDIKFDWLIIEAVD